MDSHDTEALAQSLRPRFQGDVPRMSVTTRILPHVARGKFRKSKNRFEGLDISISEFWSVFVRSILWEVHGVFHKYHKYYN